MKPPITAANRWIPFHLKERDPKATLFQQEEERKEEILHLEAKLENCGLLFLASVKKTNTLVQ